MPSASDMQHFSTTAGGHGRGGGGWQRGPTRLSSRSCEEITRMQKAWGPDPALLPTGAGRFYPPLRVKGGPGRPSSICTV